MPSNPNEFMSPEMKAQLAAESTPQNSEVNRGVSTAEAAQAQATATAEKMPSNGEEPIRDQKKAVKKMFKFVSPETESKIGKLTGQSKDLAVDLFDKVKSKFKLNDRAQIWYSSKLAEHHNSRLEKVLSEKEDVNNESSAVKEQLKNFSEKMQSVRDVVGDLSGSALEAERQEKARHDKSLKDLETESAKIEQEANTIREKKETYEKTRDTLVQRGVDRIEAELRPVESKVESITNRMESADVVINGWRTDLEEKGQKLSLLESSLAQAEFKAEKIAYKDALKKLKLSISDAEKKLDGLEKQRDTLMDDLHRETAKRDKLKDKSAKLAELGNIKTLEPTAPNPESSKVIDDTSEPKRLILKADEPKRLWSPNDRSATKALETTLDESESAQVESLSAEQAEQGEKREAEVFSLNRLIDTWNKSKELGLKLDQVHIQKIAKEKFPNADLEDPSESDFENILKEYWRRIVRKKIQYSGEIKYRNEQQVVSRVREFFKEINE
ncbi:MAG: hypothetical protein NVSMB66_0340 [Candidatus Doudnabacteria bacterium]